LVQRYDAVGNVTCHSYDGLHQKTQATYPSGSYASVTPTRVFVYDSATVNGTAMSNAAGRLAEAKTCTSSSCSTVVTDLGFSYTSRGEVATVLESTPNSSGYYTSSALYWPNGAIQQLTGPSLPTLTYGSDGEGRTSTVSASNGQNPVSSTSYNVFSLPTSVSLGSGDSDAFGYDSNTGRMTSYTYTVNSSSEVGTLTWNANGTLNQLAITDPFQFYGPYNQQTCGYAYDDLARLASVNCHLNPSGTANWTQTFTFDAFGNINKTGSNGGISFLPTYNYATNRYSTLPDTTPSYDSNGNLTADGFHSYAWDADGNWVTVDSKTYTFDALDRVVESHESSYHQFMYDPVGHRLALMGGSTLLEGRVPLAGKALARYNSSGLQQYFHADWLGSLRLSSSG
jgi:hypothetical protein